MRTYDKRIAFLISDQQFISYGGIGQFAKAFTEMCDRINWKVDIILDKAPTNDFILLVKSLGANLIYPDEPLRYTEHVATFSFSDSINFEKIANFRKSLVKALSKNLYDLMIVNTQEAMTASYGLGLSKEIPLMFYTHLHSMIFRESQKTIDGVFLDVYHNFFNKHLEFDDIIIGTQSQINIDELSKYGSSKCVLLRMPMSERGLLEPYYGPREGVLFIGRWEDGKNPDAYIKAIHESGLPARIMTNSNGARKFEKAFAELGITDYQIKEGIVGEEKVKFMQSCKVFYMPSLRENYPYAFMECLGHMPCLVLNKQTWSENFEDKYYTMTDTKNAASILELLYNTTPEEHYSTGALEYVKSLDSGVAQTWIDFVNQLTPRKSNTNAAKINSYTNVRYSDFIEELNRKALAREDFESVLTNRHKFKVVYTDNDTWLVKDPNFTPENQQVGSELFEGL